MEITGMIVSRFEHQASRIPSEHLNRWAIDTTHNSRAPDQNSVSLLYIMLEIYIILVGNPRIIIPQGDVLEGRNCRSFCRMRGCCHPLPVAQSIETSTMKSIFLWYRFQRGGHLIIIIVIIIAFKGAHGAANCLQHARSSGPGAIVCKPRATHRTLITCKWHVTCHLVRRDSSAIKFDRVENAFI